jgi:hypothetical protein
MIATPSKMRAVPCAPWWRGRALRSVAIMVTPGDMRHQSATVCTSVNVVARWDAAGSVGSALEQLVDATNIVFGVDLDLAPRRRQDARHGLIDVAGGVCAGADHEARLRAGSGATGQGFLGHCELLGQDGDTTLITSLVT